MLFKDIFYKLPNIFVIRLQPDDIKFCFNKLTDSIKLYENMHVKSISSDDGLLVITLY